MSESTGQSGEALWAGLRRRKVVRWGIACVAAPAILLLAGCGGGGGGSSGGGEPTPPPPPPQEPPVFTTATAVRVTGPTPFGANCLVVPAGATAYVDAEVEPHLALDPTNPNHLVAAWQQDRLSDGGARGLTTAVSIDGGTTWSRPQPSPFSQCAGGSFARVSDPWVAVSGSAVLQIGIAFTGAALTAGARSAVLVSRSGDGGATWSPAVALVDDDGTRYFHDKESLTIDATDPRYVYAVWDRLDPSERGITLLARSTGGGNSWSAPVRVNASTAVPAFTPTLAVLPGGLVGVTYYDFRQAGTPTFQPTDLWLAVSRDGTAWRETRLAGNFDLLDAPNANGLFVGDYQGLGGAGSTFVAAYARTNTGDTANRTDVFADRVNGDAIAASGTMAGNAALKTAVPAWTRSAEERVAEHLSTIRERRSAKWRAWRESQPQPSPN